MRLRTGLVMLAALASMLVIAPVASAAWGPELEVSSADETALPPRVATGPNGDAVVAWLQVDDCDCYTLMARRINDDGSLGSQIAVTPDDPDVEDFDIDVDADGVATVAWDAYELPGDQGAVQTRKILPDGSLTSVETLDSGDESVVDYNYIRAGVSDAGVATVTWALFDSNAPDFFLKARQVAADGTPDPTTHELTTGESIYGQSLAVAPNGAALVGWFTDDRAAAIQIDVSGTPGSPVEVSPHDDVVDIQVAINAVEQGVISFYRSGSGVDLALIREIAANGSLGTTHTIAEADQYDLYPPRSVIDDDGNVTSVYSEWDGTDFITYAAKLPHGSSFTPAIPLSDSGRSAIEPEIGLGPTGAATAVWQWGAPCFLPRDGSDDVLGCDAQETPSSNYTIQARRIETDGSLLATESLSTQDEATVPVVSVGGDGIATAAWRSFDNIANGQVFARQSTGAAAPTCSNGSATTQAGTPVTIKLVCSGSTSLALAGGPSHGSLGSIDQSSRTVTYTPAAGFAGSDSFNFTGSNSGGTSTPATVSITVTPAPLTLLNLKVSKKTLPMRGKRKPLTFDFDLSENASVKMTLERKFGRKARAACERTNRRNNSRRRCPIYRQVTTRTMQGKAGPDQMTLSSKFLATLNPGAYRVTFVASDSFGQSATARTTFIVSWRRR